MRFHTPPISHAFAALLFIATSCAFAQSTEDALIAAGVPALSREWLGDDYVKAAEAINSGKVSLPKQNTETGKRFLTRLTSTENFAIIKNQSLPFEQRMDNFQKVIRSSSAILNQFASAASKGVNVHAELTEMLAFLLRTAAVGVRLMDEFLPTIQKDEKYETRMAGLKQFKSGLLTMFISSETSLSETSFYTKEDTSLLLSVMAETLPTLLPSFEADVKQELRKKLQTRKEQFTLPDDARNIDFMLAELTK